MVSLELHPPLKSNLNLLKISLILDGGDLGSDCVKDGFPKRLYFVRSIESNRTIFGVAEDVNAIFKLCRRQEVKPLLWIDE